MKKIHNKQTIYKISRSDITHSGDYVYKKAVLSQRRPRDAPYISLPWKFWSQSLTTPTPPCLQNFYGFLLGVSLRMFRPNLKFIALSVP